MDELHKRAAHPTFREADRGKESYRIYETSWRGLQHGLSFMAFLKKGFSANLPEKAEGIANYEALIRDLWITWSSEVPEKERKTLK